MSIPILSNLQLNLNQLIQALVESLGSDPGTVTNGRVIYNSTSNKFKVGQNGVWCAFYVDTITLDAITAAAADVSLNSHKITNLATPTAGTDAVNKNYVDNAIQGISWKASVKAASTANLTLSGTQTVDGIALVANDRILVKDQTTGSQNGLYTVQSGAWVRATDADTAAEVQSAAVLVDQGTVNGNTSWVQTADGVTLGTTTLVFAQFGSGASQTAGAGLTLSGGAFSVNVDNASIEINSNILRVKALGILNSMIASGIDAAKITTGVLALTQGGLAVDLTASSANRTTARASLVESGQTIGRMVVGNITGDGSTTSFGFTHSIGTKDIIVQVYEATTDTEVFVEKVHTSTSVVTINFAVAPANAKVYRVLCVG